MQDSKTKSRIIISNADMIFENVFKLTIPSDCEVEISNSIIRINQKSFEKYIMHDHKEFGKSIQIGSLYVHIPTCSTINVHDCRIICD